MSHLPPGPLNTPYPKQMRHPAEQPSRQLRAPGTLDKRDPGEWSEASYLPVTVNNPDQEQQYRAKGYVGPGEGAQAMQQFQEYPMMLQHPGYVPEVPQQMDAKVENGRMVSTTIPGRPAVNPPVKVNSAEEADAWIAKGYLVPKVGGDPVAFSTLANSPRRPSGYEPQRYPMMINGRKVNSEAEEAEARGEPLPQPASAAPAPAQAGGIMEQLAAMQAQIAALAAENAELKAAKPKATRGPYKKRKAAKAKAAPEAPAEDGAAPAA